MYFPSFLTAGAEKSACGSKVDLFEVVRDVAGDLVEKVDLIDDFVHPKTGRHSQCYRITYRSMDRSLTDEEINGLQESLRERAAEELKVELR